MPCIAQFSHQEESICLHPAESLDYETEDGEVIGGESRQNGESNLESLVAPGMNHTRNASQVRKLLSEYVNGPAQVPWQWKVLLV